MVQPALEAVLDQPKHRAYVRTVTVQWKNTAHGSQNREERRSQALSDFQLLLTRLSSLESLAIRVYDEEQILLPLLRHLVLIDNTVGSGPYVGLKELSLEVRGRRAAGTTSGIPVDTVYEVLKKFSHLERLCVDFPSIAYPFTPILTEAPPITSLIIVRGHELGAQAAIFLSQKTKQTLRSLSITGDDDFLHAYLDELANAGYHLDSLKVGATYPSTLFNNGSQSATSASSADEDEAPILERLSKILPLHQTLTSLVIGIIGTKPSPLTSFPSLRVRQGTYLACPLFWRKLPPTLRHLSILVRLSRGCDNVVGFLRERSCPKLQTLTFAASEGKLVAHICAQQGIVFSA